MTALTLSDWTGNTTVLYMGTIPGYAYSEALAIVQNYLTNTAGGWVPIVSGQPTSYGAPGNNQTPTQAAQALIDNEFSGVTTLSLTVDIRVSATQVGQFPVGTSLASVLSSLKPTLENRLQSALNNTSTDFVSFDYSASTNSMVVRGYLTAADRVAINTEILSGINLADVGAIATAYARKTYGLNTTWMATKLYNRTNYPIVVFVGKYTDTTYTTPALTSVTGNVTTTYQGYIIYIDPVTYKIQNCLISPLASTTTTS